ncbi:MULTISPECIES: SDR family oxidoreductase [Heyndrickxia]|uniref:SDR family oxidoreductase n=1 Tax=Heyndrickxia TaxID=2837504 RepID=UPI001B2F44E9|nr:SDR family oxidoreductase [Heyndrickxia oleronia]GIN41899.1 3-ketoacyl-ACP reductase [Heyndrickxia oleronia]
MDQLHGKIAIVTGASRREGIGAAICLELAKSGADIFFTHLRPYDQKMDYYIPEKDFPKELERQIKEMGRRVGSMELDISKPEAPSILLNEVEAQLGLPAILVNNATYSVDVDYRTMTAEMLDLHYAVNVRGTCMLTVEFAKRIEGKQSGSVINLISGQDKAPEPGNLAYVATKGAISAFTLSIAPDLAKQFITVNAVDPGPTDTGWMNPELKEYLIPKFPMGRIGQPEDAARLIAFLASDNARWITGQIIHSDGGFWD